MSDLPPGPPTGKPPGKPPGKPRPDAAARRFLLSFLALFLGGMGLVAGLHMALASQGLLAPPPLAATNCIDDKFVLLREAPLEDRTLVAIGSSVTWRNLDMAVLERRFPGHRAYNAAPCYLHIDQTGFMTGFLLERMPEVETVLVVVAPRDFEACPVAERAFFDTALADAYLDGLVPRWLPYLTGFRPIYLAREALERRDPPLRPEDTVEDDFGSSILRRPHDWRPPPYFDEACFPALTGLEETVAARGARLVLAVAPIMPEWAETFDPDDRLVEGWVRRVAGALHRPDSLLIDGRALDWEDARFADPVHLLYPNHTAFTEFVAEAMAAGPRTALAGGE
ncbi:hypothetical protein [Roseomonas sp. KE0001]|uniref:hypothetical protein n=1 Tax=Roseomonas sp. KE0001 TaxID=2479201 RepID=UPI0018DFCE20|nr:hypothetical protein [Roseomonas sp. KE0001]MBI0432293.1 hypothetical protein [Roseomonas sp. KE0001]